MMYMDEDGNIVGNGHDYSDGDHYDWSDHAEDFQDTDYMAQG